MLRDMDSKDFGFHHTFTANDQLGLFPEDQILPDKRFGNDLHKGYGQHNGYPSHSAVDHNWSNNIESYSNKPLQGQHYNSNNGRQDHGYYGGNQTDTFSQYGAPYGSNHRPEAGRGLLPHKDSMNPYFQHSGYQHDQMQHKIPARPAQGHMPMHSGYQQAPPPPQMMHNPPMGRPMGGRGYMPPPPQGQMMHNAYGMNGGNNMGMRPGMPPNNNVMMGMPMGYHGPAGSNAQGRAINKMLLEILRERIIDPQRLDMTIDTYVDRMDCVNLATLLFHTGKKRLLLAPVHIKRVAGRFVALKEELRAREASNALYGLKCMTSEVPEVRELVYAIATKVTATNTDFVAQAVGNALYGLQMMTSEYEEVRYLLTVLAVKVSRCTELLEAQNVGNALYGLRNMSSDYREVRTIIAALTPRIATAREDLNGQALGNSLYGLQSMSSKESEVRFLLTVLATKVTRTWEDLKAQEVGNALYGLKRMSTDVPEVRMLISALVPKVAASPEILDAQAIGNSFYGMQNMRSDNPEVLSLLAVMADKVSMSCPELDGQAMGNSLYGLQGMSSDHPEVRAVVAALTAKIQASCLDMNAQELGNALYGLQNMTSEHADVRRLLTALTHKVNSSKHDLTSQEIGNAIFGLQGMSSSVWETRMLVRQIAIKIQQSHSVIDPLGVANSLFGLQRMSSESEDVRLLVQALAIKIEHSWKLLTAQHVANALFGLQGLSSVESEVRYLIKALVPKVASCRDELNARQLSQALFGLRSFSSEQAEVLGLVAVLADKVTASAEPWTMTQLGMALFGLQGLSSNKEEVAMLLGALAQKAANLVAERHTDPNALANGIFGLQRMNTNCVEVCHLLTALSTKMTTLAPSVTVNARMCANTIFGLQAMSCANETVKGMLYTLADWMQQVSSAFMAAPHLPGSNELYGLDKTGQAIAPADRMDDILCLYQATALSLFAMRDLDADADLQARMYAELSALRSIVDIYKIELPVPMLTAAEKRMTRELADMLAQEPFNVITAVTAHGFEMSCIVQLYQGLQLKTAAGELWTPVLNLEVRGSSYSFPCKELYARLRKHYLEHDVGIAVDTVPADSFRIEGQQGLRIHSAVLSPLYPPTMEDAANFAGRLNAMSKSGQLGTTSSPGGFFSFSGASTVEHSPLSLHVGSMPPLEYYDDDFKPAPTSQYGDNKKYKFTASPRGQKVPLGMPLGWVGEWPMPSPHPVHQAGTSPATSPTGSSAVRVGDDRGALNLNVQGSGNSLLGSLNAGSAPVGGLAPSQQFALGSGTRTSYQSELNAHSPPSPSVATRHMTKPVGYRGPEEDSDSSQSTRQRSLHQRSAQSSGNLEPFISTIGPSQEPRAPGGLQLSGNSSLPIPSLKVDIFPQQHSKSSTSASSDLTPVSHQPTIVLGFQHHTPLATHGRTGSGTSLLSTARTEQERADVTVHQELSQSPVEEEAVVGDVTEMDDEIAALEAQLEVARLEARIRELKSKKAVKTPHSAETESL